MILISIGVITLYIHLVGSNTSIHISNVSQVLDTPLGIAMSIITFFKPKKKSRRIQQVVISDMKYIHDNK